MLLAVKTVKRDWSFSSFFQSVIGTETDFFAGYRGCKCLEGFYRTHMFKECQKCGQGGLQCQDDYASLKSGYWWEWRNKTHKARYSDFIANLLTSSPALDGDSVQFPHSIPVPYMCPIEGACRGGLDSLCETGYHGPLCGVCSLGYYKQLQKCTHCPSKKWILGQLSIVVIIFLVIVAVLVMTSKRDTKKASECSLIDKFFSKLKIVIGFYQLTNGLLDVFSYIKWPGSLQIIGKYSEVLQLNVLQIAPVQCLFHGLHIDAFGSLLAIMAINAAVIALSGIGYGVYKVVIRSMNLEEGEKSRKVFGAKELVYRNLFFFLYVTYLSTCSKTASVLPPACRTLCRDNKDELCHKYLKADYSVECHGREYNKWLILAYVSTAYVFALPVASFIVVWRQRKVILAAREEKTPVDPATGEELISGLCFLFENYKIRSWYWELIEMSRKVVLTSGLILVGEETRSYIGLTWVIAGMFGALFAWMKPMNDAFENRLMTTSLAVTVVNLGVGAVSKIPAENLPSSIDPYMETLLFKILVLGTNSMVIGLIVGKTIAKSANIFRSINTNTTFLNFYTSHA